MHELSERELFEAIHYAKSIDEETGAKIIAQFQLEQAILAETIFGIFPAFLTEENQEMSYLFMDLCLMCFVSFKKPSAPCHLNVPWIMIGWRNRRYC
jgi:hypothetical protein